VSELSELEEEGRPSVDSSSELNANNLLGFSPSCSALVLQSLSFPLEDLAFSLQLGRTSLGLGILSFSSLELWARS
jgi:hypothetical protein